MPSTLRTWFDGTDGLIPDDRHLDVEDTAIATATPDGEAPVEVTNTYSTGAVQSTGQRLGSEMHGDWVFYRKDGSIMRSGSFDRGAQVGVWRTFGRDGRLVKETAFPDQTPSGTIASR